MKSTMKARTGWTRRVLNGAQVPIAKMLYSIFGPHADRSMPTPIFCARGKPERMNRRCRRLAQGFAKREPRSLRYVINPTYPKSGQVSCGHVLTLQLSYRLIERKFSL
jgi:hypothetical protein